MRILYRYNGCTLNLESQVLSYEDPTVIGANYCTAPSPRPEYIALGVMYHTQYSDYYLLDDPNKITKTFTTYPELLPVYRWFMNDAPYRSVWVDSDCDGTKDNLQQGAELTIGKSLSFSTDKTVVVGIFGDNEFKMSYDGELILYSPLTPATEQPNYNYLHLFEVDVTAGTHYFSFSGIGDGTVNDSLGVIIYDNTITDLLAPIQRSEWNVLYSSEDSLTEAVDIVTCPTGYAYDNERSLCIKLVDTGNPTTNDIVVITPTFSCSGVSTSWTIDYGDGTTQSGIGAYPDSFEHQYDTAGNYIITLTAYYGTRPYIDTESITVDEPPAYETINYGYLYNKYAVVDSREITSVGWSVPLREDYQALADYLGAGGDYNSTNTVGGKLKEVGTTYWFSPNTGATNEVGFNLRGAGFRSVNGDFGSFNQVGYLWTSSDYFTFPQFGYNVETIYTDDFLLCGNVNEVSDAGMSLRLIKDSTTLSHGQTGTYTGNNGKVYRTICIGTQEWLADNLAETKYRNGDWITGFDGGVYTPIADVTWGSLTTEAMCVYNDDLNNV